MVFVNQVPLNSDIKLTVTKKKKWSHWYLKFVILFLVHKDGEVCISILHEPGEDKYGYEKASERWLPIHTVETILMSVISMISDPNDESPANVDAAVSVASFSVIFLIVYQSFYGYFWAIKQ